MTIKVLIADDHSVVRKGLSDFLQLDNELEVVGQARDGREAVELARQRQPDVVLMDLMMPVQDGLAATATLQQELPQVKVLMLTSLLETASLARARKAGAVGYLLKNVEAETLCQAIKNAANGHVTLAPELVDLLTANQSQTPVASEVMDKPERGITAGPHGERLTDRELDILHLLAQGKTNKEIAYDLGLSDKTIKLHMSIILAKLGAQSRTQAALYAAQLKLI